MTSIQTIQCDICGTTIPLQDIQEEKVFLGLKQRVASKHRIGIKFEGASTFKDLCFTCCRTVRDGLEQLKEDMRQK